MKKRKLNLTWKTIALSGVVILSSCGEGYNKEKVNSASIRVDGEMKAELTAPPMVPKPVGDRPAKKLIVDMEVLEEEAEMTNGVNYVYWTFVCSFPGSFFISIVFFEIYFTLKNHPNNKLSHTS